MLPSEIFLITKGRTAEYFEVLFSVFLSDKFWSEFIATASLNTKSSKGYAKRPEENWLDLSRHLHDGEYMGNICNAYGIRRVKTQVQPNRYCSNNMAFFGGCG